MNKYAEASRAAQLANKRRRMCESKVAFESQAAAYQKNQRSYLCPFCGKWHRSGAFIRFVRRLQKKKRN